LGVSQTIQTLELEGFNTVQAVQAHSSVITTVPPAIVRVELHTIQRVEFDVLRAVQTSQDQADSAWIASYNWLISPLLRQPAWIII